jgi:hypothetical protein
MGAYGIQGPARQRRLLHESPAIEYRRVCGWQEHRKLRTGADTVRQLCSEEYLALLLHENPRVFFSWRLGLINARLFWRGIGAITYYG